MKWLFGYLFLDTILWGHDSDNVNQRGPLDGANAFVVDGIAISRRQREPSTVRSFSIIYGEDGNALPDDHESSRLSLDTDLSLVEGLRQDLLVNEVGLLTRIACAVAPPPHNQLHPSQVQSINLVEASLQQLQVGLAIPQEGTGDICVQILVPVALPQGITSSSEIVTYLRQMDQQATKILQSREFQQEIVTSMTAEEISIRNSLSEEPKADDLPDWWTFSELKISLARGCESMKQLLNEDDFQADLKKLSHIHSPEHPYHEYIRMARVASIGPSGIFLRAYQIKDVASSSAPVDGDASADFSIFEISIRFSQTAKNADDLRGQVLDLVESADEGLAQLANQQEEPVSKAETQVPVTTTEKTTVELPADVATPATTKQLILEARQQPKSLGEESRLAAKYAAIEDIGERAYTILKDLGMI